MKKYRTILVVLIFPLIADAQSVAINNDGSLPNASAILDIKSASKGLLIPRMSTLQRTTGIVSPAEGLKVFDTNTKTFWFFNGTNWIESGAGSTTNFWTLNGGNIYNNNSGNVGIGTSSPANKFTVQSNYDTYGITHTDGTIKISTYIGRGFGAWFGTQSNHKLHLFTNDNGIPNISFNPNFITEVRGIKPRMEFYDESGGQFSLSGDLRSSGSNLEIAGYKSTVFGMPGNLILQLDQPGGQFTQPFFAGNVGIGVSDPAYKLDISSRMRLRSGSSSESAGLWLNNPNNSALIGFVGTANATTIGLFTPSYGWGLSMNSTTGNIGIGTLNPTYRLSVNGIMRSKEVIVETGWADYVFDENYELPSLTEVEKFIRKNKHLQNIPSAKEVEENGLHLGDVQKKMMEKIEELTLYVIELKKEIMEIKNMK